MRKLLTTAAAITVFASMSISPAMADVAAGALPNLGNATNADVTTSGSNMNIQIQGGQGGLGTLNWNSFNVGKDAAVNYEFTAHNQTALNKVDAAGGMSQIYGNITTSGCAGCGYDATGKVILINPNGVLFGDGANVNLNSLTVSTMDGTFDQTKNELQLNKGANQSDFGIVVQEGANIYGDKNVTFASNNVTMYNGSKISTNAGANVGDTSFGKIKIVTADGVNFAYYNNGAVKEVSNITGSADKMVVSLNGALESGNIDIRNYSNNEASEINLNGATLKATKAVEGNDGNIWLTASNKIVTEGTKFETVNQTGAEDRNGGNVRFLAGKKVSIGTADIDAVGNVEITSQGNDIAVDNSTIDTAKDVTLTAAGIASVQNNSTVNGKNISVSGNNRAQVVSSGLNAAEDVNLVSDGQMVWTDNANINAGKDINTSANNGYLLLNDSIFTARNNVNLTSKDTVTSSRLSGSTFNAEKDVNVESTAESILLTSTEQFKPKNELNLTAAKNVEINSTDDLATSKTNIKAGDNVFLTSSNGSVNVDSSTKFLAADKIYINGAKDVTTTGVVDLNNIQSNIKAGQNVNVNLTGVENRNNGLVAEAGKDMTVTTDGTLSVSSLKAANDMTINANKVIAGLPYTTEEKLPGDDSERSYIEVGGTFNSNVAEDNYVITASGDLTDDGQYNQKHHIQYGDDEKILLVNKRPVDNEVTDPDIPGIDNGDDIDVVNPGDDGGSTPTTPTDPSTDPTTPTDPSIEPTVPTDPSTDPTTPTDPSTDPTECPDIPDNDESVDEDAPELGDNTNSLRIKLDTSNLSKYSIQTNEQKKI